MKQPQPTIITFWEELGPKRLRLIYDLMKASGYFPVPRMGLLPFVPVNDVVRLLRVRPLSPWSTALLDSLPSNTHYWSASLSPDYARFTKSKAHDVKEYDAIIYILTNPRSKLAEGLARWKAEAENA